MYVLIKKTKLKEKINSQNAIKHFLMIKRTIRWTIYVKHQKLTYK
jgi:hypothetical protein